MVISEELSKKSSSRWFKRTSHRRGRSVRLNTRHGATRDTSLVTCSEDGGCDHGAVGIVALGE